MATLSTRLLAATLLAISDQSAATVKPLHELEHQCAAYSPAVVTAASVIDQTPWITAGQGRTADDKLQEVANWDGEPPRAVGMDAGRRRVSADELRSIEGRRSALGWPARTTISLTSSLAASLAAPVRIGFAASRVFAFPAAYAGHRRALSHLIGRVGASARGRVRRDWLSTHDERDSQWRAAARWLARLALVLIGVSIGKLLGSFRLCQEVKTRREAQLRLEEVSGTLPGVLYQARRDLGGELTFPFIFGDTTPLFGIAVRSGVSDFRCLLDRVHPQDRSQISDLVNSSAKSDTPVEVDFRAMSPAGWKWLRARTKSHPSEEGATLWTGYWIDIDDAHEQAAALLDAKEIAERAVASQATFLAVMSHEIRTPMSGILGMIEMLSYSSLSESQRRTVNTIEESAALLRTIIDDILDYSKVNAGRMQLDPRSTSLPQLVAGVVASLTPCATKKGLHIKVSTGCRVARSHLVDGMRVRQILFNLVSNAIKFTGSGEIAVSIDAEDASNSMQSVTLRVADTGIGVSALDQNRLFQPFMQASASTSGSYGGTGLGLAICGRLVALMDGIISMNSVQGSGTTVTVVLQLPVTTTEEHQSARGFVARKHEPLRSESSGVGAQVLVVEDNATNQTLMAWRMEQLAVGYQVVSNGAEALEALRERSFDMVITDCQMPEMDGYELARAIREGIATKPSSAMPIIALTASAGSDEEARCKAAGMDAVLAKPIKLAELAKVMRVWLGSGTARQDVAAAEEEPGASIAPSHGDLVHRFGSTDMAKQILKVTLQESRRDLRSLHRSIAERNCELVSSQLHRLAGSIAVLGADALSADAARLIRALRSNSVLSLCQELERYSSQLQAYFRHLSQIAVEFDLADDWECTD